MLIMVVLPVPFSPSITTISEALKTPSEILTLKLPKVLTQFG
jgi:hypothetical protein